MLSPRSALPCLLPTSLLPTLPKDIVDGQGRGCVFPFGRILQQSQDALFGPEGEAQTLISAAESLSHPDFPL